MLEGMIARGLRARSIALFGALLGLAMFGAAPASAEREASENNGHWDVVNAGGCSVILNDGALYLAPGAQTPEFDPDWPAKITWSGPCGANGLANGKGTLTIAVYFKERNFSTDYRSNYKGEMRNGVMSGPFSEQTTNNDGTGNYTSNYPPETVTYTNGCDAEWDFSHECKFADAQRLQAQFGGGGSTKVAAAGPAPVVPPPTYVAPTTFTTVGGAVAGPPPSFGAGQETALGTVADGLVAALGGRGGVSFSTGSASIDTIIGSLRTTLGLNGNAALGGRAELLDVVLGQVRSALGGANPASTNGQIADLVMNTLRSAIASSAAGPKLKGAAGAPAPTGLAGPESVLTAKPKGAAGTPVASRAIAPVPAAPAVKLVSASNVQSVIDYLASKGDSVTRSAGTDGNPILTESGNLYSVVFDCQADHAQCAGLELLSCYDSFPNANLNKANAWNRDYFYGRSYIDANGRICIAMPVATGTDGISYDALDTQFTSFLWFRNNAATQFQ